MRLTALLPSVARARGARCNAGVRRALLVALVALVPAAAAPAGADQWSALYRPLRLPDYERGAACPVSRVDTSVEWSRAGVGGGIGSGPVYPILGERALIGVVARREWGRTWRGTKVLWFVHQRYRGPVLLRGRRLGSREWLRFDHGTFPRAEIRIAPGETVSWRDQPVGSRGRPSYVRARSPGCYAVQVDGTSFSRVIVFRIGWGR